MLDTSAIIVGMSTIMIFNMHDRLPNPTEGAALLTAALLITFAIMRI